MYHRLAHNNMYWHDPIMHANAKSLLMSYSVTAVGAFEYHRIKFRNGNKEELYCTLMISYVKTEIFPFHKNLTYSHVT